MLASSCIITLPEGWAHQVQSTSLLVGANKSSLSMASDLPLVKALWFQKQTPLSINLSVT